MSDLPTGTVTFLYTDIEGSTRRWEQSPTDMKAAVERHDAILRRAIAAHSGLVFRTMGDAFCAAFAIAPHALLAAIDAQRALHSEPWSAQTGPIRVRMAVHTGTAEVLDGDYVGPALNRIARLLNAGHGGQVLVSQAAYDLVCEALKGDPTLAGVELRELGVYSLRDIERPDQIFQLVAPDLQASFPALRTERSFFTNLPVESGLFIGRHEELGILRKELSKTRLLTITGAGGVGKTRMALHLAREVAADYKDGVVRVELASLSDPDLVVQTVASAFSVGESGTASLRDSLTSYLQKKVVLLLFDNCEHLLDACADFISALLSKSAELKVIATSRERLDMDGETVYNLPMLALPKAHLEVAVGDVRSYAAMELFVAEAVNAGADFAVTERNVGKIAEICKHLDGNALAIKLAASLTPTLSVDEMLERLRERFEMLVQGPRQTDPRHRTLKAAIDWSYELLSEDEATVFRRLAIFAGAWPLKAAESVCADEKIGQSKLVTILNSLVRKNLVVKVAGDPESRFGMLETIREYAAMRLRETNEVERLQHEHAKYFVTFTKEQVARVWGAQPQIGLTNLEQDYDDLVNALEWARKTKVGLESGLGLQLAAELGIFWERRGYLSEGRERLAHALRGKRRPEHDRYRSDALDAAARLAFLQNDYPEARALYEKSLKIRRQLASAKGDIRLKHGVVGVLNKIGLAALRGGDFSVAEQRLLEARDLARETNHTRGIVGALNHLAELAWRQGDYEGAQKRYEECIAYARRQQGKQRELLTMDALTGLGKLLMMQGKYDEATASLTASLDIRKSQPNKVSLAFSYSDLSEVAFRKGDYETARRHAEESLTLRQEARNEWGIGKSLHQLAQVKHMQGLSEEALQHAIESMSIFERLQYKKGIAECLLRIASIKLDLGEKENAAKLCGAAESLLESLEGQLAEDQRDYYESALLAQMRGQLDSRIWASGRYIGPETAILLAQERAKE